MTPAAPPTTRPAAAEPAMQHAAAPSDLASKSEAELIAQVLAGPEPAIEVLRCGEQLARLPFWQRRALGVAGLVSQHGIPPRHALRLAALWELAERWFPDDRPTVTSARDALLLLSTLGDDPVESVALLMVDARYRLLTLETVAVGTVNVSRVQPRDILVPALRRGAAAILVAHSHPSGDPRPSGADRRMTTVLREAAAIVGIPLLDHLVVTRHTHHSFRRSERWDALPGWSCGDDEGY
jgi:DNA repair protein RadC